MLLFNVVIPAVELPNPPDSGVDFVVLGPDPDSELFDNPEIEIKHRFNINNS